MDRHANSVLASQDLNPELQNTSKLKYSRYQYKISGWGDQLCKRQLQTMLCRLSPFPSWVPWSFGRLADQSSCFTYRWADSHPPPASGMALQAFAPLYRLREPPTDGASVKRLPRTPTPP